MGDTTYIHDDVHVRIDEPEPIRVTIDDATLAYGNLPRGGDTGDILVKTSPRDYHAEWMSMREAGYNHIYYDTTANWNAQSGLVSEEGAIYIYSDYFHDDQGNPIPGIRIGDGRAYLIDLPVASEDFADKLYEHITNSVVHVSAYDRSFWNNKVTSALDSSDPENLILTKDFI